MAEKKVSVQELKELAAKAKAAKAELRKLKNQLRNAERLTENFEELKDRRKGRLKSAIIGTSKSADELKKEAKEAIESAKKLKKENATVLEAAAARRAELDVIDNQIAAVKKARPETTSKNSKRPYIKGLYGKSGIFGHMAKKRGFLPTYSEAGKFERLSHANGSYIQIDFEKDLWKLFAPSGKAMGGKGFGHGSSDLLDSLCAIPTEKE